MSPNRRTTHLLFGFAVLAVAAAPRRVYRADMGPKPTMQFRFEYEVLPEPAIVSGVQEECDAADCSDARPLPELGPQRLTCTETSCESRAYTYTPYHRLKITFSDGVTRQSNVFEKNYFYASYAVTVRESDLLVEEQRGRHDPWEYLPVILACMGCVLIGGYLLSAILLLVIAARPRGFGEMPLLYVAAWIVSLPSLAVLLLGSTMQIGLLINLIVETAIAAVYSLWRKRSPALVLTVVYLLNLVVMPVFLVILGGGLFAGKSGIVWVFGVECFIWLVKLGVLAFALRKKARFWESALLAVALSVALFVEGMYSVIYQVTQAVH